MGPVLGKQDSLIAAHCEITVFLTSRSEGSQNPTLRGGCCGWIWSRCSSRERCILSRSRSYSWGLMEPELEPLRSRFRDRFRLAMFFCRPGVLAAAKASGESSLAAITRPEASGRLSLFGEGDDGAIYPVKLLGLRGFHTEQYEG